MDASNQIKFLQNAVISQRTALRFHLFLAFGVIFLGLAIIVVVQILSGTGNLDEYKWLLMMGGTFFATLSSFPIKELFNKKDKVVAIQFLIAEFERLHKDKSSNNEEVEKLETRFWQFVDKSMGS